MQDKLEFLVRNMEEEIMRVKMDKAHQVKNNIQTDKMVQFSAALGDQERELEKVLEKNNTSSYDLGKKMDQIRALRSQRAVVSTLFDKIQRELCNLEHCYKVLVIERKREEDVMNQVVDQFNHCEASAHKELSKMKERNDKLKERTKINAKINTQFSETKRNSSSIDQLV